jgi:hypothetical protein
VYHDGRHLLFVIPPLLIVCALAWNNIYNKIEVYFSKKIKYIFIGIISIFVVEPAYWAMKNHPFQNFYFSPLIGGIDGAFKKYEIDFWGASYKAAVEWIIENKKPKNNKPVIIAAYYGADKNISYYVDNKKGFYFIGASSYPTTWDYFIMLPATAKQDKSILQTWPPQNTIHQIKADNTPLCAIIENTTTK